MLAMAAPTAVGRVELRGEGAFEDLGHLCGVIGRAQRMTAHHPWALLVSAVLVCVPCATDRDRPSAGP